MKKTLLSLTCILLMVISCSGDKLSKYKKIAADTSKRMGLPTQIDAHLRMDSVVAVSANELSFHYTVLEELPIPSDDFEALQRPLLIETLKKQAQSYQFKTEFEQYQKDSITLTYVYLDKSGSPLARLSVKPQDYK